jgi:multidrug efflux pump subunit AcrB
MSAIPFGMTGAIFGHLLMGSDLSMFSVIGMVALSGVVVNDSLVLVDYVNRRVRDGVSVVEAATSAGAARFRAVLLTSLTTFVGLAPLLLERSLQAQFLIPMAISLAFGVLFSTAVTLVLVPTLYLLLDDAERAWRRWRHPDDVEPATGDAGPAGAPVRAIPPRRQAG